MNSLYKVNDSLGKESLAPAEIHNSWARARYALHFLMIAIAICFSAIAMSSCTGKNADKGSFHHEGKTPPIVELCQSIDYADTASLHNDKSMAVHMKKIVKLMMTSDSTATARALDIFFRGLDGDVASIRLASRYANLYLNNPNSPVRDETLYLRYLTSLLNQREIPEGTHAKATEEVRKVLLNRPGTVANDFRFIDREGNQSTLHSLRAPRTMLIFYDPECPHCPDILQRIAADTDVNTATDKGDLKVLAVYTEGKRDLWEKTKQELPGNWTVAYDLTGILDADLYDIPAMPTVYLLDDDKTVLIKDMLW